MTKIGLGLMVRSTRGAKNLPTREAQRCHLEILRRPNIPITAVTALLRNFSNATMRLDLPPDEVGPLFLNLFDHPTVGDLAKAAWAKLQETSFKPVEASPDETTTATPPPGSSTQPPRVEPAPGSQQPPPPSLPEPALPTEVADLFKKLDEAQLEQEVGDRSAADVLMAQVEQDLAALSPQHLELATKQRPLLGLLATKIAEANLAAQAREADAAALATAEAGIDGVTRKISNYLDAGQIDNASGRLTGWLTGPLSFVGNRVSTLLGKVLDVLLGRIKTLQQESEEAVAATEKQRTRADRLQSELDTIEERISGLEAGGASEANQKEIGRLRGKVARLENELEAARAKTVEARINGFLRMHYVAFEINGNGVEKIEAVIRDGEALLAALPSGHSRREEISSKVEKLKKQRERITEEIERDGAAPTAEELETETIEVPVVAASAAVNGPLDYVAELNRLSAELTRVETAITSFRKQLCTLGRTKGLTTQKQTRKQRELTRATTTRKELQTRIDNAKRKHSQEIADIEEELTRAQERKDILIETPESVTLEYSSKDAERRDAINASLALDNFDQIWGPGEKTSLKEELQEIDARTRQDTITKKTKEIDTEIEDLKAQRNDAIQTYRNTITQHIAITLQIGKLDSDTIPELNKAIKDLEKTLQSLSETIKNTRTSLDTNNKRKKQIEARRDQITREVQERLDSVNVQHRQWENLLRMAKTATSSNTAGEE